MPGSVCLGDICTDISSGKEFRGGRELCLEAKNTGAWPKSLRKSVSGGEKSQGKQRLASKQSQHEVNMEKEMATHSSILAWKIPWTEEPGRAAVYGAPVFLPGESQGRGSLVGCLLWGRTELDTTEVHRIPRLSEAPWEAP